jgi:hypothetical protein
MSAHGAKELRVEVSDIEFSTGSKLVDITIIGPEGEHHEISVYFDGDPILVLPSDSELERAFDIVDDACDFWKQEAINRGYEE